MTPLISVVMPTMPSRRRFVHQAIHYFLRQTWPHKELVLVDSFPGYPEPFCRYPSNVRYVVKAGVDTVGAKMNFGAKHAAGEILVKWDDDDWYHPEILSDLWELMKADPEHIVPRVSGAPFFLVRDWRLKISTSKDWVVGGVIPFHRRLWEQYPFQEDLPSGSDYEFRKGLKDCREAILRRSDRYALVRHGVGHTWKEHEGQNTENIFKAYPDHSESPETFFGPDLPFYQQLRAELLEQE